MIFAGIGCRHLCPAEEIVALVTHALAIADRHRADLAAVAIPAFKADEDGLHEAARHFGTRLILVDDVALRSAAPRCVTRSVAAERATGFPSVAEGAAIAAAGVDARLVLPRIATSRATCALATGGPR